MTSWTRTSPKWVGLDVVVFANKFCEVLLFVCFVCCKKGESMDIEPRMKVAPSIP